MIRRAVRVTVVVGVLAAGACGSERPEATESTSSALKQAASPPNFRLFAPNFENVAGVAPPQVACPTGTMFLNIGAGNGILSRPLYGADGKVDTTPNIPPIPFPIFPNSVAGVDNNIVHLTDGTFLNQSHGATWRAFTNPPAWQNEVVNGQVGARWAMHFTRSDACGLNWQTSPMLDIADVQGGIYALPRPSNNPGSNGIAQGIDVGCMAQYADPVTGQRLWWIGGGDRPEVYACPYTGNVYVSFWLRSGPYCTSTSDTTPPLDRGVLMVSRDLGQTWEFMTELPVSPPYVMTSTPDGRLYMLAAAGPQAAFYFTQPTAPGQIPVFVQPPMPSCGLQTCPWSIDALAVPPAPNQDSTLIDHHHYPPQPALSRISTDRSTSKVRAAYPAVNAVSGMQQLRVMRVEIPQDGGPPLVKPITLVSAEDPVDHSTLYFNFNDPDIITKPAGTRSNTSMGYWMEPPRCRAGEQNIGRQCRDPSSDSTLCGAAQVTCPTGQVCNAGACVATCPAGRTVCTAVNGSGQGCFDTNTSTRNCGSCGNRCAFGQTCSAGVCVAGNNKPAYGVRHMFFEGDCRATQPRYLSVDTTGANRNWEGTNNAIGDYVKGASWWNNGQLNFLGHWSEPAGLMGATTVSPFGSSSPELHVWTQGRTQSEIVNRDNQFRADGYQTVDIDSHVATELGVRVTAVSQPQTAPTGWVEGHTVADFETAFDNFTAAGFRLEKLSSFVLDDGGVRVDALWEQNSDTASSWIQGFTVADFLTENTIRTGAGQRIDHLSSWVLPDGSVRVDAVWHSVPGAWAFVQGFTVADFVTEDTMRRSTGWRLDELQSFVLADGGVRVDALWHIGPEQSFWVRDTRWKTSVPSRAISAATAGSSRSCRRSCWRTAVCAWTPSGIVPRRRGPRRSARTSS